MQKKIKAHMTKCQLLSDNELLKLLKKTNRDAFNEISRRYLKFLASIAHRKIKGKKDGEDLIFEVFVNLWEGRKELNIHASVQEILVGDLRRLILQHYKLNRPPSDYIEKFDGFLNDLQTKRLPDMIKTEHAAMKKINFN